MGLMGVSIVKVTQSPFSTCVSSLERCLLRFFLHFLIGLFVRFVTNLSEFLLWILTLY